MYILKRFDIYTDAFIGNYARLLESNTSI